MRDSAGRDHAGALHETEFRLEEDSPRDDTAVVAVFGDVDLHSAEALDESLVAAVAGGATSLVVDLSSATFVDSQGLGVLLRHRRRLDPRGGFRLVVPRAEIRRVFEVSSLDQIFPIDASREDALASLPQGPPNDG